MPSLTPASEGSESLSPLTEYVAYGFFPGFHPGPTAYPGISDAAVRLLTFSEATETLTPLSEA